MTEFEKAVKWELLKRGKKQKWLVEKVAEQYEGSVDAVVINKAIKCGMNIYPQVKIVIARILNIRL